MSAGVDRGNRARLSLLGLILLVLGGLGLAAGFGAFDSSTAQRSVLTDDIRSYPEQHAWFWWAVAAVLLVIALLALRWLLIQLRTDRVGSLSIDRSGQGETMLRGGALTHAVEEDVESFRGVRRASASLRGRPDRPTCRIVVDLDGRGNVGDVRDQVESTAVPHLRRALEDQDVPVDVRLRLAPRDRRIVR
jgi:hypothetical protein